jgi:Ca2+-binding EF-hand superfamily protein
VISIELRTRTWASEERAFWLLSSPVWWEPRQHGPSLLRTLDPDNDGTVDLAEARSAASKLFDRLDRDHDGTLDKRELRGRLNAKALAAADADNDGTLDKNEFLALVEKRFKAANPDNDGTIDAKELKSSAGALSCYSWSNRGSLLAASAPSQSI